MRLNKYISETGVASRREADAWIEAGRVSINGAVATLGAQVNDGDVVCVDGRPVGAAKKHVYIALNKPVGITSTTERDVQGNIVDLVNYPERIFPIGRLDKDSEGLILLTNNGDIVNEILRSENEHEKEYIVTVDRAVTEIFLNGMASGVRMLGTVTKPCKVQARRRPHFPHRSDAGAEPSDPQDVFVLRLQGRTSAASADHQRHAGWPQGWPVAGAHSSRGPQPVARQAFLQFLAWMEGRAAKDRKKELRTVGSRIPGLVRFQSLLCGPSRLFLQGIA